MTMTWDELLGYCLAKPGAWRDEPWDGDIVVKVGGKIFAFLGSGEAPAVGLKCGPKREVADEWLVRYPDDASVMAYIGRSGWNSLRVGGAIADDELLEGGRRLLRPGGQQAAEEGPARSASEGGRGGGRGPDGAGVRIPAGRQDLRCAGSLLGHCTRATGAVRNPATETISQVPRRKTGQTNLVTPWYV